MGIPKCPQCGKRIVQTEGFCPCGQIIELTDKEKKRVKAMQDAKKRMVWGLVGVAVSAALAVPGALWVMDNSRMSFGQAFGLSWFFLNFVLGGLIVLVCSF